MVTRASLKRKRRNCTTKNTTEAIISHSLSNKRTHSNAKSQSITNSSTSTSNDHGNNLHDDDESDHDNGALVIDCTVQPQSDCALVAKQPAIGGSNESNTKTGSVVLDINEEEANYSSSSLTITPTTNRITSSYGSLPNRPEHNNDQHCSPSTTTRKIMNQYSTISSSPISTNSPNYFKRNDARHTNNLESSNINRNVCGIEKKTRSINSQLVSNLKGLSQSTVTTGKSSISYLSIDPSTLESVPEYRNLKRELEHERQKCTTWPDDYRKLKDEFDKYRVTSFPRPSVDGLKFLLELVENLTVSSTAHDLRTQSELAKAIGLTEDQLMDCCHPNPQRAALQIFSKLYPTYRDRAELKNIKSFSKNNSKLLNDILTFSRPCNPSTNYCIEKMREAIAGSIRQAKHQLVKIENFELKLSEIGNLHNDYENDTEQGDEDTITIDQHVQHNNNTHSHGSFDELDH
ncbi:unnamed protein product [Rotaria sp. Silwood2]|nr:unnamed protein product [Rotaria sp. Silwood2]CAF3186085.1 unnamed protein product [Rotaria sp. Silwood2]CAF3225044.1 unnamed protein product [Rotaria sp. Silwood2]CAF4239315.1 unnamed protein product [Rotaria sp. Silwood2]CAF4259169.1 unnamed protein product [Rotaria sp. Silwood2]